MWKLFTLDLGYNDIFATYIFIKKKKESKVSLSLPWPLNVVSQVEEFSLFQHFI